MLDRTRYSRMAAEITGDVIRLKRRNRSEKSSALAGLIAKLEEGAKAYDQLHQEAEAHP